MIKYLLMKRSKEKIEIWAERQHSVRLPRKQKAFFIFYLIISIDKFKSGAILEPNKFDQLESRTHIKILIPNLDKK